MKQIQITQDQVTYIDDKDYKKLSKYKWYALWNHLVHNYYAMTIFYAKGKQQNISMSGMILGLKKGDKRQPHHKNHDTLDNRRGNLQIVTASENQKDRKGLKGFSCDNDIPLPPNYSINRTAERYTWERKRETAKAAVKELEQEIARLKKTHRSAEQKQMIYALHKTLLEHKSKCRLIDGRYR